MKANYTILIVLLLTMVLLVSCKQNPDCLPFETRIFKPSARVYFDTGKDEDDEIDIFNNGSLNVSLSVFEIYWPYGCWLSNNEECNYEKYTKPDCNLPECKSWEKHWRIGPVAGFGFTGPGNDSKNGSNDASGAPVVLATLGLLLEKPITNPEDKKPATVGIEFGYALGWSADEGLRDSRDGAIYAGVSIGIPW